MVLRPLLPFIMGAVMGLMMLWMLHGVLTGQSGMAGPALLAFIAMHFLVVAGGGVLIVWATRYAPSLRQKLSRLHRPSLRHISQMVAAAAGTAIAAHLILHGGL